MTDIDSKQNNSSKKEENDRTAVALSYDTKDTAPVVVASGKGFVADRIIKTANDSQVPIHHDKGLAESLSSIEIGEAIPEELYEVVAEVLVAVDKAEEKYSQRVITKNEQ